MTKILCLNLIPEKLMSVIGLLLNQERFCTSIKNEIDPLRARDLFSTKNSFAEKPTSQSADCVVHKQIKLFYQLTRFYIYQILGQLRRGPVVDGLSQNSTNLYEGLAEISVAPPTLIYQFVLCKFSFACKMQVLRMKYRRCCDGVLNIFTISKYMACLVMTSSIFVGKCKEIKTYTLHDHQNYSSSHERSYYTGILCLMEKYIKLGSKMLPHTKR